MDRDDLVVTIPIPCDPPRARGRWATTVLATSVRTRVHNSEIELIEKEAKRLGVTRSAFLRWCAVKTAEALRDKRRKKE